MKNPFINSGNKPTRAGFGEGLVDAAIANEQIIGLGADITASVGMDGFAARFPARFFSLGIAEQNVAGVAAGLALAGKIPVFSTYAVFAAFRAADQIRVSICYNNLKVLIGGAHAGISVGADGATHQALEDIAAMRAMPNMTVLSPCDANQTRMAFIAAVEKATGPVYLRFGREPVPNFTDPDFPFEIGKIQCLLEGNDCAVFATGIMVWEALRAAELLAGENIHLAVLNVHTIKPLDQDSIMQWALKTGCIVTAEEHQVFGGLGGAIAEVLVKSKPVPVEMIAMPDCFGESGNPAELMKKYGLTANHIVDAVKKVMNRKKL